MPLERKLPRAFWCQSQVQIAYPMGMSVMEPPKWDMTVVFPSLESAEFKAAAQKLQQLTEGLEKLLDDLRVSDTAPASQEDGAKFDQVLENYDQLANLFETVLGYVYAFVTTDATNDLAQSVLGSFQPLEASFNKNRQRLLAWVGTRDEQVLLNGSKSGAGHTYLIQRAQTISKHSMSQAEEALAAEMNVNGADAFGRLHGDVTSQMQVTFRVGAEERTETMPTLRALAYDPSREVRQAAYEAELDAWTTVDVPCAAAMNAIKGSVNLLCNRRGWASPLDEAVFLANIDRATLDAMIGAAKASLPELRRYFRAKAKVLTGGNQLEWFDMFAPVGKSQRNWNWQEGSEFVAEQFGRYSQKMADFARRAYQESWIDAAPAPAKRDGAFCMPIRKDESRILQTWKESFGAVSTLAHELGHGYHNLCLHGRTSFQRETPATVAETASIFCEQIISQAALDEATGAERLNLLDQSLQRCTQTVVDILSRFLFESEVFERRQGATLSAKEFSSLMHEAQEATYGDALTARKHPYMWAVKPHYYSTFSFYNFPYMFGLLFSLGLYSVYLAEPESFKSKYDDLLSRTGMADAAELAAGMDIDIRSGKFWEGSLARVIDDVVAFEAIV